MVDIYTAYTGVNGSILNILAYFASLLSVIAGIAVVFAALKVPDMAKLTYKIGARTLAITYIIAALYTFGEIRQAAQLGEEAETAITNSIKQYRNDSGGTTVVFKRKTGELASIDIPFEILNKTTMNRASIMSYQAMGMVLIACAMVAWISTVYMVAILGPRKETESDTNKQPSV